MAHVLRITDGTVTVNLADSGQILNEYIPAPGDDGEELTEIVKVTFAAANMNTNLSALRSINDLLKQASRYKVYQTGAKVYVEFDPGTSGTIRRALLTGGTINTSNDTLGATWANNQLEAEIRWLRMGGWEWPEVEIPLTNTNGSGTGGINVTNHNYDYGGASDYENWVEIDAADITGDMPARVRLEIKHTYSVNPFMRTIYVHHKVGNVDLVHFLEGEAGSGGTNVYDPYANANYKKSLTWSVTTKTKLLEWTIPADFLNKADHTKFHLMPRIDQVAYTDLYLQLQLKNQSYTLVAESALTQVPSTCIFLLDTMRLPPGQTGGSNAPMVLELWGQRLSAGSHTIYLDFLYFSPIADESWREYVCVGATGGLKYNETLIDDGINNLLYREDTSNLRVPDWSSKGGPLLLQPGRDQRLYFTAIENNGGWRNVQTFTIRAYYRPRTRVL